MFKEQFRNFIEGKTEPYSIKELNEQRTKLSFKTEIVLNTRDGYYYNYLDPGNKKMDGGIPQEIREKAVEVLKTVLVDLTDAEIETVEYYELYDKASSNEGEEVASYRKLLEAFIKPGSS